MVIVTGNMWNRDDGMKPTKHEMAEHKKRFEQPKYKKWIKAKYR